MHWYKRWRGLGLMLALALAAMMLLAACGDDDDNGDVTPTPTSEATEPPGATEPPTETETPAPTEPPAGGTIEIAQIPGWPDSVSTSNLWKVLLEDRGYDVEIVALDVAPAFAGLAGGDLDVYTSSWLPNTHGSYMEEFGSDLAELDSWYSPAGLYLTVPDYVDVDSLADLADNADLFDGQIVGIEAGAGMMGLLANDVMPAYGLDDWELIESSTPAMLAELQSAISNGDPIVVTLWSPGWWYGVMDLKNLEDPEGAWGEPDLLTPVTRAGFADDFPEVAGWMSNWQMTDEEYAPLEELISEMEGDEEGAVRAWLVDNEDLVNSWFN